MEEDPELQDLCSACQTIYRISEEGFPVCPNPECGKMNLQALDYSPEWRSFGADDGKALVDSTRCGNPVNPLFSETSFGCQVLCQSNSSIQMRRIQKWISWQAMPHRQKSLFDVFQQMSQMALANGIPKRFIDEAMAIYKHISEQKIFRGIHRDGIKAASIYIACRLHQCPRTAHEIACIFKLDKTSATNGCSMAMQILNNMERFEETLFPNHFGKDMCMTNPSMFLDRYCSKLDIPSDLNMLCKFVAKKLEDLQFITDNTPHAVAAGIVFFVAVHCQINISKKDMKLICGVSEVTINKCYKKINSIKDSLLPISILQKYGIAAK